MRVPSCKLQCLSICSSKSSHSLQSSSPLKLEDTQRNVSSQSSISHVLEEQSNEEKIDECQTNESGEVKVEIFPKSSLKKPQTAGSEEVVKGRVKWMDFVGKELVEVREFEPMWSSPLLKSYDMCDSGESEDEDSVNQSCVCTIQ